MPGSPSPSIVRPVRRRLEDQDREQLLATARRLLAEADALSSRISAVNEIGVAINQTLDIDAILKVVGKQAKWLLDFEYCSVCLRDPFTRKWRVVTLFGPDEADPDDLEATSNIGPALRTRQPQLLHKAADTTFMARYASQFIVPLIADGAVLGTINFGVTQTQHYTTDDMRIGYMLALQVSSAIRNANNFVELMRTRDELSMYATELEARNEELDAFSYTIAHDLKSPLNVILLRTDLIRMTSGTALPDEAAGYLDDMRSGVYKMNQMIDQILWLAKLRHREQKMTLVEIEPLVESAIKRFEPLSKNKDITVGIEGILPDALGHAAWIEEVFANLISNAIKYMGTDTEDPYITIRGFLQDQHVRYEVEDTGIGIDTEDQARLFTMFDRLNTISAEGLGLGLSIVHRIVTKLGGRVGVESVRGKGSTFWFTLSAPTSS